MINNPLYRLKNETKDYCKNKCVSLSDKNIIYNVYYGSILEGINKNYEDIERICQNGDSSGFTSSEVVIVNNIKHAWEFITRGIDKEFNYDLVCTINRYVASNLYIDNYKVYCLAGEMRNINIRVDGTDWTPRRLVEWTVKEQINGFNLTNSVLSRSIIVMCYLMRTNVFMRGNINTAILAANHILISNGIGIICIKDELQEEFKKLCVKFYETNDSDYIEEFIKEKCIQYI